MNKKTIGLILIIVGIIILLLSLLADTLGIGGTVTFGYKQTTGVIVGLVLAIIGFLLNRK